MKIVHFESGLGNQMLNYAEYLAIKYNYDDVVSERLIYESKPDGCGICQWNGYELDKVFGINIPDLSDRISLTDYECVKKALIKSKYWENGWKYAVPIVDALNDCGYNIENRCTHGTVGAQKQYGGVSAIIKNVAFRSRLGNFLYRKTARLFAKKLVADNYENMFIMSNSDFYCGQSLNFMYKGQDIERIEEQLRRDFLFKNISARNEQYAEHLKQINSVCLHVRRGDFLERNVFCYEYGYFKRAVKLIKKRVKNPVFVIFTESKEVEWIKGNLKILGLSSKDRIELVDWNGGENSFQDMYLMTKCGHNIITQSSFGWWGSWLNENPDKITISPDCRINTTDWV